MHVAWFPWSSSMKHENWFKKINFCRVKNHPVLQNSLFRLPLLPKKPNEWILISGWKQNVCLKHLSTKVSGIEYSGALGPCPPWKRRTLRIPRVSLQFLIISYSLPQTPMNKSKVNDTDWSKAPSLNLMQIDLEVVKIERKKRRERRKSNKLTRNFDENSVGILASCTCYYCKIQLNWTKSRIELQSTRLDGFYLYFFGFNWCVCAIVVQFASSFCYQQSILSVNRIAVINQIFFVNFNCRPRFIINVKLYGNLYWAISCNFSKNI